MSDSGDAYRESAALELYAPPAHQPRKVGEGLIPTFCRTPGWWARLWGRVRDETIWTCWCGKKWRWSGYHKEWRTDFIHE